MEKTYKLMNNSGALSIAIGVIVIVVGVSTGVLAIINGAKLLLGKNRIEF